MAEITAKQQAFIDAVEQSTPAGYTLVCGWPDEENSITYGDYCEWAKDLIDNLEEGTDIGSFQTFEEWKRMKRDENPDRDNLGFTHDTCELCGTLPGDRYAVTAIPQDPANSAPSDYYTFEACTACYSYVANGDLPED